MFNHEKDVSQLLSLVDSIERLGIDRHFQEEIKQALDFVYRFVSNSPYYSKPINKIIIIIITNT